ncbi:MAG: hypothetical protein IIC60_07825 [Proteobacteria bacterium]|nr:hypothetical protein [Pseudomonadota bacterium]
MRIQLIRTTAICTALLALLASNTLFSQAAVDAPEKQVIRPSLKYVDAPVAIIGDLDPILPSLPVAIDPEQDPEFLLRSNSIREYNSSLERIELNGGAWDRDLVEELATLGSLQQQQGQHPEAIDTFSRAIHVNRINAGLHTLEQIPVVEQLIDSYLALGDWEQVDIYHNYLFYIQQKAFGSNDPRIIPVLEGLATWNIQAFSIGYGEALGVRLSTAQILFSAAARMVRAHFGKEDERFIGFQKNIANSAYLVSRNPELMAEVNRPEYRSTQDRLRERLNERTPAWPRGFQVGELALREIADYYAGEGHTTYESAEALTNIADWYLLFERRRAAFDQYEKVWRLLGNVENGEELIQRLFGQVVPLPTFASRSDHWIATVVTGSDSVSLNYEFVDLVFDVTANGIVRNIRTLSEETEENASQLGRLRRVVRNSIFRPLLVDGKPVRSSGNQFRYRYWY